MPFEIPDNIHELCAPLAWMLGGWHGNGHGEYPTIDGFQFGQEVVFQQDGRPFIHYFSRAWIVDEHGELVRNAAQETGFFRPQPEMPCSKRRNATPAANTARKPYVPAISATP